MCLFGVQGVIGFQRMQNLRMTKTLMSLHILCKILSFLSPRRTRSIFNTRVSNSFGQLIVKIFYILFYFL